MLRFVNLVQSNPLTETAFTSPVGTSPIFGNVAFLEVSPDTPISGNPFNVAFSGTFTVGTSSTLTVNLRLGNSVAGTLLWTSFAMGSASALSGNFAVNANLLYDSVSQNFSGNFWAITPTGANTFGAIYNPSNGAPFTVAYPSALQFCLTASFSASDPKNVVTVSQFYLQ